MPAGRLCMEFRRSMTSTLNRKNQVEHLARSLIAQHLGHRVPPWTFRWNRRKSAIGVCNYRYRRIEFSEQYLHLPDEEVRDTVLHEIAHALAGSDAKHGPRWQYVARQIGAKAERVRNLPLDQGPLPQWVTVCDQCSRATAVTYRRRTDRVLARRRCPRCYGPVKQLPIKEIDDNGKLLTIRTKDKQFTA